MFSRSSYIPIILWELVSLEPLVFLKLRLQVVLNDLINGLNLTVGLRMINRIKVFLYVELVTEFPEFPTVELRFIIRHDLMRYAKSAYYCLPQEALNLLAGDRGQ